MSDHHNNACHRSRLAFLLSESRKPVAIPVGTLVDRHTVKLRGCGGYKADALLAIARAIRDAANSDPLFARMSRAIRSESTIDLWIADPVDPWRAAVFTLQLHSAFKAEDLFLMVSTYVPFGHDGDTSQYPVEESTAYKRGTQDLRAVVTLQARRVFRSTQQSSEVQEAGSSSTHSSEDTKRYGTERSGSWSETQGSSSSSSNEYSHLQREAPYRVDLPREERSESRRRSRGNEHVIEHSTETGWSQEEDQSVSDTTESDSGSRSTETSENESVNEITQEVSFVAVGTDFTDAERLWAVWRSDPANADIGTAVELMLSSVGSLAEVVEQSILDSKREARAGRAVVYGDSCVPEFWNTASCILPVDRDGTMWRREVLAHDGYPAAISQSEIEEVLQRAQKQIGTSDSARRFLGS